MSNELVSVQSDNYFELAQAMGMVADMDKAPAKSSTLPRLRIWHKSIMGETEVKGKIKNVEVVPAGSYRLELPDKTFIYASEVKIRVFVQRFMYKRYDEKAETAKDAYVKTVMAENLNSDLVDTSGGYNCGKPAGFIKDFASLPEKEKDFIGTIKRVRVLLGEVELINPLDENGEEVELDIQPFIWEIDNKTGFKRLGEPINHMAKNKRLSIQHWIDCRSEPGESKSDSIIFYVPTYKLDLSTSIELDDACQQKFNDFLTWIQNYNEYVINESSGKVSKDDEEIVNEFLDISNE